MRILPDNIVPICDTKLTLHDEIIGLPIVSNIGTLICLT
jgi:hypothetical protein